MSRQEAWKEKEDAKASFSKSVEDVQCSQFSGQYSNEELIDQLKGLALDPCRPQFRRDNIQPLWNQILGLRILMVLRDSEMTWRKRKLEQLIKDKQRVPIGFVSPDHHIITKRRKWQLSQASSISCLLNSVDSAQTHDEKFIIQTPTSCSLVTFDEASLQKRVATGCSFAADFIALNCTSKDVPSIVDSDESVNGSNPCSPEAHQFGISEVVKNLNLPSSSHQSIRLLNFIGDHFQTKIIPVGPRFQADVTEWDETVERNILTGAYNSDSDNLKWLGSQVWPTESIDIKSAGRKIGKGRQKSCSCVLRGSANCIKRHILEERQRLLRDLGPAFSKWKFDEMGEQVSKSWSAKEKQTFESLMKKRTSSNGNSFWKRALKCFPRKSKKDIVNYYFNVYIPNRMSLQRRSPSIKQVDTDDEDEDEAENSDSTCLQERTERRTPAVTNKKTRYLRSS